MSTDKNQIICNVHAIVSIIAGTASLVQECQATIFASCRCPECSKLYWKLVRDKYQYLSLYPYCPNCGCKIESDNVTEDKDVIGAEAIFLQKDNQAYASFKVTHKALEASNIKEIIKKCDVKFIV